MARRPLEPNLGRCRPTSVRQSPNPFVGRPLRSSNESWSWRDRRLARSAGLARPVESKQVALRQANEASNEPGPYPLRGQDDLKTIRGKPNLRGRTMRSAPPIACLGKRMPMLQGRKPISCGPAPESSLGLRETECRQKPPARQERRRILRCQNGCQVERGFQAHQTHSQRIPG